MFSVQFASPEKDVKRWFIKPPYFDAVGFFFVQSHRSPVAPMGPCYIRIPKCGPEFEIVEKKAPIRMITILIVMLLITA